MTTSRLWLRAPIILGALLIGALLFVALERRDDAHAQGRADVARRLETIKLPAGFTISVYAADVPGARSIAAGPRGTLFVGTRASGKVYAVVDRDGDQKADRVLALAEGLEAPNGVAWRDKALYVAENSRILRFDDLEAWLADPQGKPRHAVVKDDLPRDRHHGWKFIRFGPDGLLYVPIGAPCNVCARPDPYATIARMRADGSGFEVFARGVRNSVGFDWDPRGKEMWFTDNGRDMMGDDVPPDELNHAPRAGMHFGFPHCHGRAVIDPEHARGRACREFAAPAAELGPHVAALGMRFYTGTMFPERWRRSVFIAEHGSWNRSAPIGYRIMTVRVEDGRATGYEPFAHGWLQGRSAWGRPVDVEVMPDGALVVSDDERGALYRIAFTSGR